MSREYTREFTALGLVPLSGSVLFHDNFEGLLHFTKTSTGGDEIFELDPTIAYTGLQSLNMKTRTVGSAEADAMSSSILTHLSPSKLLTSSLRFYSPDFTKIAVLQLAHTFYDSVDLNQAYIEYHPNTPVLKYFGSDGATHNIPASTINLINSAWHLLTLRLDFRNNKYISLTIDNVIFDLSALSIFSTTDATFIHLLSDLSFNTNGAAPAQLRLDEFSLTET